MLSRTADSLFWLARYVERADSIARLIDMGRWMRATPGSGDAPRSEWPSILAAAGCARGFYETHDAADQWPCIVYLMLSRDNPSSVLSCFEQARANARGARAALTVEMWEAVNDTWIELRALSPSSLENGSMSPLLDWIRQRGALLRGAADSTALRNDGFAFLNLGFHVERLDNTARLLDVRAGDPTTWSTASARAEAGDPYDWMAILRAAGVLRAYHAAYNADYHAKHILDFLILNPCCPRSIAHCAERILMDLEDLARFYGRREVCHMNVAAIVGRLRETSIDEVVDADLHGFLTDLIIRNNQLAKAIADAYHFAPQEPSAEEPAPAPPPKPTMSQAQSIAKSDALSGTQAQFMNAAEVAAE